MEESKLSENNFVAIDTHHLSDLYNEVAILLPQEIMSYKDKVELSQLSPDFIEDVIRHKDDNIDIYHSYTYKSSICKKKGLTLRDIFLQKIIEMNLPFQTYESYSILDRLIEGDNVEVKLSTLLGHTFNGDEYSFDETNISFLAMKSNNIVFFRHVLRMMKYLTRKGVMYIDYPQYYSFVDNKPLVEAFSLKDLHRSSKKVCTYYNNYWIGNETQKSSHSNPVMGILSFFKHGMEKNLENDIY